MQNKKNWETEEDVVASRQHSPTREMDKLKGKNSLFLKTKIWNKDQMKLRRAFS